MGVGAISRNQYYLLAQQPSEPLRKYFVSHSAMVWPEQRRQISKAINSDKLLVVLVTPPMFFSDKIFTPRGYLLMATKHGKARARTVVEKYMPGLARSTFMGQWSSRRSQMNGLYAADKLLNET